MIDRDISEFAKKNWEKEPITAISRGNHGSLVESDVEIYNFDKICSSYYSSEKKPTSADGMVISEKCVELIEFKSGFRPIISKENFDEKRARCKKTNQICEEYWEQFEKRRKHEIHELILYIRLKALESYITLEKKILPQCNESRARISLKYTVVIDGDAVDNTETILADLAGRDTESGPAADIKKALKRFTKGQDACGKDYYYDSIEVLSVQDFANRLRLHTNV